MTPNLDVLGGSMPDEVARRVDRTLPILRATLSHAFEAAIGSTWSEDVCPDAVYLHDIFLRTSAGTLAAMLDGAAALPALIRSERAAVALFAVGRSTVETAALGTWLFASGLSERERARRAASMTLDGLTDMDIFRAGIQTSVRKLVLGPDVGAPEDPEMKAEIEWWLDWARRAGYETRRSKRHPIRHTILDERLEDRPRIAQLVEGMLAQVDSDHVVGEGQAYYRIASAVAHGDWHARAILGFTGEEEAHELFAAPSRDATDLVLLMAVQAATGVVALALEYLGHSDPVSIAALSDLRAATRGAG